MKRAPNKLIPEVVEVAFADKVIVLDTMFVIVVPAGIELSSVVMRSPIIQSFSAPVTLVITFEPEVMFPLV